MRFYSPYLQNKMYNQSPTKLNGTTKSLKALFDEYLFECEYSRALRPDTLRGYNEVFTTFQKIMSELKKPTDLFPQMMNEFYKRLKTRKRYVGNKMFIGVKQSTIKTYHNKLMAFFRWLENNNYIIMNSLSKKIINPPNPIYDDEKSLSKDEVSKIISAITLNSISSSFIFSRDLLIASIFLYTGIRKGELLALKIQDVDFENRIIFIKGVTSKSKKNRSIPLHFSLLYHLKSYFIERKKHHSNSDSLIISKVKGTPLTQFGLKHWVQKYSNLSGVKFHLHRFRHTFACNLVKENADIISIMNVMGHTTTRMTERYLRSIRSENSRKFIENLNF